jgi:hypothetical protein
MPRDRVDTVDGEAEPLRHQEGVPAFSASHVQRHGLLGEPETGDDVVEQVWPARRKTVCQCALKLFLDPWVVIVEGRQIERRLMIHAPQAMGTPGSAAPGFSFDARSAG